MKHFFLALVSAFALGYSTLYCQLAYSVSEIAFILHPQGWVKFKPSINAPGASFFDVYGVYFGLGSADEMRLVQVNTENSRLKRYRFQQYHNGTLIEGAEYVIHELNGKAYKGNGRIVAYMGDTKKRVCSKQDALTKSITESGFARFAWDEPETALLLGKNLNLEKLVPNPRLIYKRIDENGGFTPNNLELVYSIVVTSGIPWTTKEILLDAHTLEVRSVSLIFKGCDQADAHTYYQYDNTQQINVMQDGSTYLLEDDCTDGGNKTFSIVTRSIPDNEHAVIATQSDISHGDLDWPDDDDDYNVYVQAHWSAMRTYEYFAQQDPPRYGWNEGASDMLNLVGGTQGTHWIALIEAVCLMNPANDPNGLDDWPVSLDVVGHEWTHAITDHETSLKPTGESGAIYESLGDIFGSMVECFGLDNYDPGNSKNCELFTVGEDYAKAANIRNMINPNSHNHPDTYCGSYWYENQDIHARAAVMNRWFTLLALGSGGTKYNNHCCGAMEYSVSGIGKDKAALVTWRALVDDYLLSSANFVDARLATESAAEDLVSESKFTTGVGGDAEQVTNAWLGVGVLTHPIDFDVYRCLTYTSSSTETLVEAVHHIVTGDVCPGPSSNVIESGADIEFVAGSMVQLKDGFHAKSGGDFHARIDDKCDLLQGMVLPASDAQAVTNQLAESYEVTSQSVLLLGPNPADEKVNVWVRQLHDGAGTLSLVDNVGNTVTSLRGIEFTKGNVVQCTIVLQSIPNGRYSVVYRSGHDTIVQNLVVVR